MPDRPRSRSTFAQITAYSDGFSGKEREPTGRLMPLRQPSRRKESCQNFTIRYGQLALVSERPSEEALEEPRRQKKSKKPKTINPKPVVQQYKEEQETLVRVTTVDQYMASTEAVVQPQTPVLADQSLLSSTPAGNTSPTKRKSQTLRLDHRLSQQLQPRTISQRQLLETKGNKELNSHQVQSRLLPNPGLKDRCGTKKLHLKKSVWLL